VKALNRWAISILLLQYIFLLLNITPATSLIPIPDYLWQFKNMSVIQNFISDPSIASYFAFDSSENSSLLLNALVVFLIEIYFTYFLFVCSYIIKTIILRRQSATTYFSHVWINFIAWNNAYSSIVSSIYEG